MKIAITGCSGFIGSHVLDHLCKTSDHQLVIATRSKNRLNIRHPNVSLVDFDLDNDVENTYSHFGEPDILIHLAWGGLPNYHAASHQDNELPRQCRFLENMVEAGLQNLFVAGTCLEYGLLSGELDESMRCAPTTSYGKAKNSLRLQLETLKRQHDFNLTWARLFYIDSDEQGRASLLSSLKESVDRGDACFDMSGGLQRRDFLSIDKVSLAIGQLAQRMQDLGVVNICSGDPITVKQLVLDRLKERNWHIDLNLGHYPYPDYEPMDFWGSRVKLNSLVSLEN